eukprot:CAMPEP_0168726808 /NCGR_PEP_ID=MMETSP0724-20121128/4856_1 /TAXON_ID=265536 /ORGANISM="Amphiprora sp., Strain CCMP467" /LENGTH=64 /DNA_ID=CAMNT_0008773627 /DNA_START=13 /DNA_END=207 /DNA_ORIENTATION=-
MDSLADAGKERLLEQATEKIKEKAGCFGCFVGCLGPKGFMKVFGCCALDGDTAKQVNDILDKVA